MNNLLKHKDISKESGNLVLLTAALYAIHEMDIPLLIDIVIKASKFNRQ